MARDTVDLIIEQWRRERPELDHSPIGVFGRVARLAPLLQREIEEELGRHGLTGAEYDVLATLRRSGPPHTLTPTELSRSMMISSGAMTYRLDQLERRDLLRRSPDPGDRRGILVTLTADGVSKVDETVADHLRNEERVLAALRPTERDALARLLRTLLVTLEPRPPEAPLESP
jgi:DNA-binding MarR family transcriptional regulator